jgi:GntR family transcriptional regulator
MHSGLHISQTDARPMYLQILEQIRERIAAGDWTPGRELPSIRGLAAELRVSVITVKRAYVDLEAAGIIVTRQGKGSFVADVDDLARELKERELDEHLGAAAEVARTLGLDDEALAARLRSARREMDGT